MDRPRSSSSARRTEAFCRLSTTSASRAFPTVEGESYDLNFAPDAVRQFHGAA